MVYFINSQNAPSNSVIFKIKAAPFIRTQGLFLLVIQKQIKHNPSLGRRKKSQIFTLRTKFSVYKIAASTAKLQPAAQAHKKQLHIANLTSWHNNSIFDFKLKTIEDENS